MEKIIRKEYIYSHNIEKVWSAITDEKKVSQWFIKADFKPEIGYKYQFEHEDTIVNGEVLEVTPFTKLIYTWTVCGLENAVTTVIWELEEVENGTKLILIHSGFDKYEDSMVEKVFEENDNGWSYVIGALNEFLEHEE